MIYLPTLSYSESKQVLFSFGKIQDQEASVTQLLWDKSVDLITLSYIPPIHIQDQLHLRQDLYSFFIDEAYFIHALDDAWRTVSLILHKGVCRLRVVSSLFL